MRPKIANQNEVKAFIEKANKKEKEEVILSLFDMAGDVTILPPRSQTELVLHTLIFPPKEEITIGYWWDEYRISKWSTRLGDIERKLGVILVKRENRTFINRFLVESEYKAYIPILEKQDYIDLYNNYRETKFNRKPKTQTNEQVDKIH